jgi:DNA-binding MarR family transcriptional regulator
MAYTLRVADISRMARKIASECPGMRIRKAARTLSRVYDENLRAARLQLSQLTVLVAVAMFGEEGANVGALAHAMGMDRTTLTRNLRPLEKNGLLRVARCPTDARVRLVLLTRSGERAIESAFPLWEKASKRVQEGFGVAKLRALVGQLNDMVRALLPAEGRRP